MKSKNWSNVSVLLFWVVMNFMNYVNSVRGGTNAKSQFILTREGGGGGGKLTFSIGASP